MAKDDKNPKGIRVGAFLLSAFNLTATIIGLLTTDTNLLFKRLSAVVEFITKKKPMMDEVIAVYHHIWPVYFVLSALLVIISYYELKEKRIPHMVTLPGLIFGIILAAIFHHISVWYSLAGTAIGLVFFYGIFEFSKGKALGFGVVMMEGMIGAFFGPMGLLSINLLGVLLSIVYYFFHMHRGKRVTTIEAGPVLALAAGMYIFISVVKLFLNV